MDIVMNIVVSALLIAAGIFLVFFGVFILITLWALIRPHISFLIDKYWDWFEKRMGL